MMQSSLGKHSLKPMSWKGLEDPETGCYDPDGLFQPYVLGLTITDGCRTVSKRKHGSFLY